MRKLALLLIVSTMVMVSACDKKEVSKQDNDKTKVETSVEDTKTENKEENTEEIKEDSKIDSSENETVAQILLSDFKSKVRDKKDPGKLAELLLTNKIIKFKGTTMEVEPGPLNGFSADIKGFKKGVMFSPMIGTIPFVGYVFTVEDGEDVNKFIENLEKNADKRWNICTEADEMVVSAEGNTVFFVKSPSKFEE